MNLKASNMMFIIKDRLSQMEIQNLGLTCQLVELTIR
jgi:hypothetical protein